jgi:hypothetical protein
MGVNVFANGMEISCKKSDNKSIAAMPDICLSPPSPPAGPIPIPYPNFSQASDTSDGTKTVKLGGQEAGIKNESNYKTSKGDEAATRTLGMGTVTHTIQGKTKFAAWSMDVKFEGSNVPRFGDITTHNHMNTANSGSTTTSVASADADPIKEPTCEDLDEANKNDQKRLPAAYGSAGNTNTNYHFSSTTPSVASETMKAHSKIAVQQIFPNEYVEGNPAKDRLKKANPDAQSNVDCPGSTFRYSGEYFKGGHTEARIVERLFANSSSGPISGTLKMKINWQPTSGGQSPAPCEHCHALLCAASQCGLKIVLCSEDDRPVPLEEGDCQKDLDMRKEDVRKSMKERNLELCERLKTPAI